MATLRGPDGCPWDREQTPRSLRPFLLEETYEALDAIDRGDEGELSGELGDVLFQCVFQAQIAAESGRFDIADSLDAITRKLIRRHPHVFTPSGRALGRAKRPASLGSAPAVLEQWERLKAKEQASSGAPIRLLSGVPRTLPSLARAHEIGARVAAIGFDWARSTDVVDKIEEEVRELRAALGEHPARATEELGDLLFSLANLARKLGLEPESALREANDKFTRRFAALEDWMTAHSGTIHEATLEDLERAWAAVKTQERPPTSSSPSPSARGATHHPSRRSSRRRGRS